LFVWVTDIVDKRLSLCSNWCRWNPYSKLKKAHRDAKLLFEYKVKVLAQCFCPECVNFRSKKKWYDPESNFSEDTYTSEFSYNFNELKLHCLFG
jgi:hypothetical protein